MKIFGRKKHENYRYYNPDGCTDRVIEAMTKDYVEGKITRERFEEYVENRLQGRTPVDKEGWPLYYEPSLLDGTEQFH